MLHIKQALSADFIKDLIRSTIKGIEFKDCYYDQLHYINRNFIRLNSEFLTGIVLCALSRLYPKITADDLVYVNDFVAPINLQNARIHTNQKNNKYGWHVDGIDRSIGPCYNLWIPLYQNKLKCMLNNSSLFDVLEPENNPELYDENNEPKSGYLIDPDQLSEEGRYLTCKFLGITEKELLGGIIVPTKNGNIEIFPRKNLKLSEVVGPQLGDVYVFNSNQYHASGPSDVERIGISIKFLVRSTTFGFQKKNFDLYSRQLPLANWESLFVGCYNQFGDFTSYEKYIGYLILNEQYALHANQDKLNCISNSLKKVYDEI